MSNQTADVVVIGMGPGGEDVAGKLAEAGLDVVGIDRELVGGECPYWGCIPSKMMIRAAHLLAEARRIPGMAGDATVMPDWAPVAQRIRDEATDDWDDTVAVERFGVDEGPPHRPGWLHKAGNEGFIKLVADTDRDVLVGAIAMGPNGGEVLGLLTLAVHAEIPIPTPRQMIYAYPTLTTTIPMICSITWGPTEELGNQNNSLTMDGTGIEQHDVVLPGAEAHRRSRDPCPGSDRLTVCPRAGR